MLERLRSQILPEAVRAQAFGPDVRKFVSFEPNVQETAVHIGSEIFFGDITVQRDNGELRTESIVIKLQDPAEPAKIVVDTNATFYNEVLFYTKVVPLFQKYDTDNILSKNICEFIYGKATNGQNRADDVLIFKNLGKQGFKLTKEQVLIDKKHVKLALDRIAKYHAISLKCQWDDPKAFQEVVAKIKRVYVSKPGGNAFPKDFLKRNAFRGIDVLRGDPNYKDRLANISSHCENVEFWLHKFTAPSEPLSVLTHGDFCRNNIMFKYDENGDPVDVALYDWAYIKFCSPTIDTNFLLLMNTSPETRRLHWDEFLRTYYNTLAQQLTGYPEKVAAETTALGRYSARPSLESIRLDWRLKGIYGYYFASSFQPLWMFPPDPKNLPQETPAKDPDVNPLESIMHLGGTQATEYLAEIVKHMLDKAYIFEH